MDPTNIVAQAETLARQAHESQFRWDKKTPYITHPEAVVQKLRAAGVSDTVLAAGWLHDVAEDTQTTLADIHAIFGPQVADLVNAVTRRPGETYTKFIARISRSNRHAIMLKIADLEHNLSSLGPGSLRDRYERALFILEFQMSTEKDFDVWLEEQDWFSLQDTRSAMLHAYIAGAQKSDNKVAVAKAALREIIAQPTSNVDQTRIAKQALQLLGGTDE